MVIKTRSDIRILALLLARKEERFTIRKMSEETGLNYRIAYEQAMRLEHEATISIEKVGNARVCRLSGVFDHRIFEAECLRREVLLRNKDLQVLYNALDRLRFPYVALLFGSRAKGTAGRQSDVDVMTIGGEEVQIRRAVSVLPGKIHLTCLSVEGFLQMARSRDFSVVSEAQKSNIVLVGIEDYHRLLQNAGQG